MGISTTRVDFYALTKSILVHTTLVLNYIESESEEGPAYYLAGRLGLVQGVVLLTAQSWQDWEQ